jgi:thiamine-phosphate pyrophosphorylase
MSGHPGAQKLVLPRLYAILDLTCLSARDSRPPVSSAQVAEYAKELVAGGVTLLQYRAKSLSSREILGQARELKRIVSSTVQLIMNDRADLCLVAGFDGLHLGQDDLSPEGARKVIGEQHWIGVSTHNLGQLACADAGPADYLAIGPIFGTRSKQNPDPVVGLEGLRAARRATRKPLVAIGGITRQNCRAVVDAGADSVAVISDLVNEPRRSAEEFLRILL